MTKIMLGVAAGCVAALVAVNLNDLKRYLRIRSM
jgi:hypothetical protein